MVKKFKKLLAMVLSLAILATFCAVPMTASAEKADLKFNDDGKFKIVVFSDVQDQFPVHQRVLTMMEQALDHEKPDFVVFTGDMTEINTKDVEVDYRRTVEQILGPVVEAGVPYSIVFGNHDPQGYEGLTDKDAMLSVWQTIGDCRTTDPAPELYGTGTCKVPIYASNGNNLAFNLWMVDSNSYQNPTDNSSGYDNPHADQLAWMKANNDAGVNSIVFQHIPMPETYNLFVQDENGEKTYGDKKYKLELKEGVIGTAGEFPATIYAHDNTGEFQTLKEMGNVLGVVTGHDHLNDFTGTYDGISMTAVPGMTYFNYGDEAIRGYGVIELDEADLSKYDYHSVKFSTLDEIYGNSSATTYDEYDEISFSDLKTEDGQPLNTDEFTITGTHNFTYDATSPSKSAVFKFRWTAGTQQGMQFSFDKGSGGNIAYPFGVWIKKSAEVAPNGAWHLKPDSTKPVNMSAAIKQGETFDIEFGRKKVLTGEAQHVGSYYVYLKVNGVLIQEGYSYTDDEGRYTSSSTLCQISNVIRFGEWSNGQNKISEYVEPAEQYAAYDVIEYNDLLNYDTLKPLAEEGMQLVKTDYSFKYTESEAAASTHSVILKLRWTKETYEYFQIHLGSYGGKNNFAYRMKNDGHWQDRALDKHVAISPRPVSGDYYDFEVARLMVTAGSNAGKYYTYFKVDGEIIFEKYVAADDENTTKYLNNVVYFGFADNQTCFISDTPYDLDPDSPYYEYDEVHYSNLFVDGNPVGKEIQLGKRTFTYERTSPTYSAVFKYRWKAVAGTQFQLSFDKAGEGVCYMFGAQLYAPGAEGHTNNSIRLRPGLDDKNAWKDLPSNIEDGKEYDVEFARLKVRKGPNKGKYYVYFKLDGKTISESYVDVGVVDANGNYRSNSTDCALSNQIYLTFWNGGGKDLIYASPYEEKYDVYDEIGFNDLYLEDVGSMDGQIIEGGDRKYTYDATSGSYSVKFQYRWIPGGEKPGFTSYLDDWVFPFCFCAKYPGRDDFGATAGENGAWHLVPSNNGHIVQMKEPVVAGKAYDIEMGRLKVKNGENKGKYYVYVNVNGELIKDYYYDGVVDGVYGSGTKLSNKIIIASQDGNKFCDVSMPVEEPEVPVDPNPDAPYYDYDEITYTNLKKNGSYVSSDGTNINSGNVFTYDATSPTYSAIFKFRWTVGSGTGIQFSFDKSGTNMIAYPFGVWVKKPNSDGAGANGAWHLRPTHGNLLVNMDTPATEGKIYDIELARLKVKNGDNAGKYHVYLKVDGKLIQETYVEINADGTYTSNSATCQISNEITFCDWGGYNNVISATPVPETYDAYDEIEYSDLYLDGNPVGSSTRLEDKTFTYNKTSETHSLVFKYRWKPTTGADSFLSFDIPDDTSKNAYRFGVQIFSPNADYPNGHIDLRPGYDGGVVALPELIKTGKYYDIEFARKKVLTGPNNGKYLVYFKMGDIYVEEYVDAGVGEDGKYTTNWNNIPIAFSNKIRVNNWGGAGCHRITSIETYDAYDEVEFTDLMDENGNKLEGRLGIAGGKTFTYNKTSASHSVVFKYRWRTIKGAESFLSFDMLDDGGWAHKFGVQIYKASEQYPYGYIDLTPGVDGGVVGLPAPINSGNYYDIAFARLKVLTGPNSGKYLVYFKMNDIYVEEYIDAGFDENGKYTSNWDDRPATASNKIYINNWGSNGNLILTYNEEFKVVESEGIKGDFDGNEAITLSDLVVVKKILLGVINTSEMPEGIADLNNDGDVNILDFIVMSKELAKSNNDNYAKQGSLVLGMQEHQLEDETKTAEYIADATATMGASAYRLSQPIHTLYYVTDINGVAEKADEMAKFEEMVAALEAKGITEILYVTDSFILPYGYSETVASHNKTVPDPITDPENYIAWLTVNAAAFKALAEKFPQIKFFEPYNEINVSMGSRLEKPGIGWDDYDSLSDDEKKVFKYSIEERAGIMADLCWYISRAVKSVDSANQVTTPSISADTNNNVVESGFLEALYTAIESGKYPTNRVVTDTIVDNYFTIINIHLYPKYTDKNAYYQQQAVDNWANDIKSIYDVVKAHGDGTSRVWLTETGLSTMHPDGVERDENKVADIIELALQKLDNELTFIDTVFFYKIADISEGNNASYVETNYGLFYSGDAFFNPAYKAKPSAEVIYSFFNGGTENYKALEDLADRYAE